ncbi:MAG: folylpolyglutamate synthase/dihydrofolate synthase family protein [Candidatus Woesearchaeota archaeon]|jgi:dihydrofolate synthase/folylpolyglutamate synthase|nr:folylpolyglutamate synthase/dihydrofolate synthase family protein [Candidatus Woesearchaeota archaeon]
MGYKEVLGKLYDLEKFGLELGLGRVTELLNKLRNPQKDLKVIHVTGTNGKGSTSAMISSILVSAGYKVGMYTSPHLVSFRERLMINSEEISKEDVVSLFNRVDKVRTDQTFFEVVTAMAFLYFFEQKVDYLVLEVGLGGRLDATNVVGPLVSVITNIGLEHTKHLGETIEKIAFEKAGIIKEDGLVVTGCSGNALDVIKGACEEKKSRLYVVSEKSKYELGLLGEFQKYNAAVAVKVIEVLKENGVKVGEDDIISGLANVKWRGRLEFVKENVLVDCAHNPIGMKALKEEVLKVKGKFDKLILIIGVLKDKGYKDMLKAITPLADKVILTKVKIDRAAPPSVLKKYVDKEVIIKDDVKEAVKYGQEIAGANDLVVVCGSIYVVGNALRVLDCQKHHP